ncbi:erythromycin esterase family protein [Nocardiopsis changdeensis]|uniref:Erythromycin esterase family protein n=1 Tax=Nocardiopsis changdeensis TaxID=2831969 RepID=A0ABX8BXB8_9ACTN|nr:MULTISPECIES: erythromycin esterase family protein [Nocardiopsis]QUX25453.1 erythromycin esterase family protein [Nocardiopsis changdeensis]QYX35839.1 erythromycin esterase family protein [Nocardiopsis sp. MT53]
MAIDIAPAARPVEADAVLDLLPARPRLLALGEPAHGQDALLRLRNDLFRILVEQAGYRTIALESDCLKGRIVDGYVTSGTGTLDRAVEEGFGHGWGAFPGNRDLVRWMRAYNEGRPASERVRFAGFDGPLEITAADSPRRALTGLHGHLAARVGADLLPCTADTLDRLLGDDGRWTDPEAMMDPARSVGRSAEAVRLRLIADDLVALLDEQAPRLVASSSREEWERARQDGRTALGLLRYHHWMADTSPGRMGRLLGVRDAMMAAELLALAERGPVLASGHNSHFQRQESTMTLWQGPVRWWSAGALAGTRLGEEYAFWATAVGAIGDRGVGAPPPDTVEGMLYALPGERCVVDPAGLATALAGAEPAARVSPWFGYAPLDPAHLPGLDGLAFARGTA